MNQLTLLFIGTQGSGKGTQIELLKKFLQEQDPDREIVHFEMGKNLRELAEKKGYVGEHAKEILARGELIPYAVSCSVFVQYLLDHMSDSPHLIIDGFPRTKDQVPMLHSALEFFNRGVAIVVCLNISDEEAVKRLLKRGRSDDTEEGIRRRLEWSREETMPNLAWFRSHPEYKVVDVDGERSVETIHADILKQLGLA